MKAIITVLLCLYAFGVQAASNEPIKLKKG